MADPAAEPPLPAMSRLPVHALIFGGVAGVLSSALRWAEFEFGFYGSGPEILALLLPVIAVVIGVQRWRDGVLGGGIRFAQAFGAGLAIGLLHALVFAGFSWLHFAVIEPGLIDILAQFRAEALREAGWTAERIAEDEALLRQSVTPRTYAIAALTMALMISFVASLLAALFIRRKVS